MSGSGVVEWNADEIKQELREDCEEFLEIAAGVVEGAARLNLNRIGEPKWGRKYRAALSHNLKTLIEHEASALVARIGLPTGIIFRSQKPPKPDKFFLALGLNAELDVLPSLGAVTYSPRYGWWIEMGSSRFPAHPWLRPALLNNLSNIRAIFGSK